MTLSGYLPLEEDVPNSSLCLATPTYPPTLERGSIPNRSREARATHCT
jgi:hypothetical protein